MSIFFGEIYRVFSDQGRFPMITLFYDAPSPLAEPIPHRTARDKRNRLMLSSVVETNRTEEALTSMLC